MVVGSNNYYLSLATCGPSVACCTTKSKCLGPPFGFGIVFNAMDYSFCWVVSRCGVFYVLSFVVGGAWFVVFSLWLYLIAPGGTDQVIVYPCFFLLLSGRMC